MEMYKEWNISKQQKDTALCKAKKQPWFYHGEYADYWNAIIMLGDDNGLRVQEHCFWCGYFESLVGADIESVEDGLSFRIRDY